MTAHFPIFTLRLSAGRSIGHNGLRAIWQQASRSRDVSVTRTLLPGHEAHQCVYTLSGTRGIEDLAAVESRLRALVQSEFCNTQVTLTRLC
jgi:hypothetical protein